MLAFRALERDESGSFTEECELGMLLENDYQAKVVEIHAMIEAYFEAMAKSAKKHHGNG